jgi:hypothetical protein
MSKRGKLRRKVVLPVTVIRRNGEERLLAHTLDMTEVSARLGGLGTQLEPGEVIEIQRGAVKAKFQVHWIGTPASALAGQAGIRGVDPNKSIWGIQLPADEADIAIDTLEVRIGASATRALQAAPVGPEQHARYECSSGATLRAPGSNYPVRVQVKAIHIAGMYVETIITLPLNTVVAIEAKVEGIQIETAGMVTSSTTRVGMDIAFHKITAENQRKVLQALQKLKQKAWDEQEVPPPPPDLVPIVPPSHNESKIIPQAARIDACRLLITICQTLSADFDCWKSARSGKELEELRRTVAELHKKLSAAKRADESEYLAASFPRGRA